MRIPDELQDEALTMLEDHSIGCADCAEFLGRIRKANAADTIREVDETYGEMMERLANTPTTNTAPDTGTLNATDVVAAEAAWAEAAWAAASEESHKNLYRALLEMLYAADWYFSDRTESRIQRMHETIGLVADLICRESEKPLDGGEGIS